MPAYIRTSMKRIIGGLANETRRAESDPTQQLSKGDHRDGEKGSSSMTEESRNPVSSQEDEENDENSNGNSCNPSKDEADNADESTAEAPLLQITDPDSHPRALKVLFLSSDTGGGHRASATSLAQQFSNLFPGSAHALCDIVQLDGPPPYNMLVKTYKHLSAHPQQWKLVYNVSNTRAYEMLADVHMKSAMERSVRRRIRSYDPDVVVSVHPLMTNVPVLACRNIAKETGKHLPIFTVCTDLGSAHSMWFANGVEKLFVASDAIRDLAMQRGKVPLEKIVMSGLPIRNDFAVQATKLGERHSPEGKFYQRFVRDQLGLEEYRDRKTVLVMGGGEGCGRLSNIVDALYLQFVERGMEAVILVVCGRNESLKESLAKRDWEGLRSKYLLARTSGADFDSCVGLLSDMGCIDTGGVAGHLRRIISTPSLGLGGHGSPFSPSSVALKDMVDGGAAAVSLPASRSGSPTPSEGNNEGDNVEVVTKSTAERNNLYDLKSLLQPIESNEETGSARVLALNSKDGPEEGVDVAGVDLSNNNSLIEASVKVVGLGFITKMADYMVAADVLVSKAGPGTIAEAASLSLPVMLTSFLPGQEEGNVDYVIKGEFGTFVSDADPQGISDVVAGWLLNEEKLKRLSDNAQKRGAPDAAAEIVEAIGESALRWKKIDESHHSKEIENVTAGEDGAEGAEQS
eukprot:CAMPEP_0183703336 /NCGR_PEP_ID=MMETSP0737-20130205/1108_1 /TAXON_ID=385413 /ORGANISM="Thalassiosira miniscula, Strain CCMP1093" /LENGTH=686 /DNA_ID=CAMNT_0025930065 /DNA_START=141 /DNA_END=2201 /DNA_ORIENTATION=-